MSAISIFIRISSAYKKASAILPIVANKYESLSDDEIEHINQNLFRLAKLQDTIEKRLFQAIFLSLRRCSRHTLYRFIK
jgi:hypothetical protein